MVALSRSPSKPTPDCGGMSDVIGVVLILVSGHSKVHYCMFLARAWISRYPLLLCPSFTCLSIPSAAERCSVASR